LSLFRDITYALRLLARQPRFRRTVIITMALGIGAPRPQLFSVTVRRLDEAAALVHRGPARRLKEPAAASRHVLVLSATRRILAWREQAQTVEEIAAVDAAYGTLSGLRQCRTDSCRQRDREYVSRHRRATCCRAHCSATPDELSPVVVFPESLWRERLGGDTGHHRPIHQLDGESRTVVGVLAR
jgi:hypothetical protein